MATINIEKSVTGMHPLTGTKWHHIDLEEVASLLQTNLQKGLKSTEISSRQALYGVNELTAKPPTSPWLRLVIQSKQPFLYILLIAGFLNIVLGYWTNTAVILGVIVINVIVSYVRELKAEKTISILDQALTTKAVVVRDAKKCCIPAKELTPGDLVLLASGNKVPADLRLISANNLQVDQFALTRESLPVSKNVKLLDVNENTSLSQRTNIVYAGSFVTFGEGSGIVIDIGNNTQLGLISEPIPVRPSLDTRLTRKLNKFSQILTYIILSLASFTFVFGIGLGRPWGEMFNAAVALAVSAIPYSLPVVITIIFAIGIERMARRHIIIRKLPAIDSLIKATVICSDKTGTLTENKMTVKYIYAGEQQYTVGGIGYNLKGRIWQSGNLQPVHLGGRFLDNNTDLRTTIFDSNGNSDVTTNSTDNKYESHIALRECLVAGLLCNDSHLEPKENQWVVVGDSTEGALVVSARKAGLSQSKQREAMPRLNIIPFEAKYQYMATLHGMGNVQSNHNKINKTIYIKGSVEAILSRSKQTLDKNGNLVALNSTFIEQEAEMMAKQGLRVLAFAKKIVESDCNFITHDSITSGLIFLGLQGMIDLPKQEVFAAIKFCHYAGIKVQMITGEHIITAVAVGYKLGLGQNGEITAFKGQELAVMNDAKLEAAAETGVVFARVAPEQKLHLVKALQAKGEIVAVTGNSVNDALALKLADIAIAMGKAGTDVAKEAADILLMDDNFASITTAVEEGRSIYQNLHKAIAFILPVCSSESMTVFIAVLVSLQLPILPIQILWLSIVNVIMTVSLAFEPKSNDLMKQPLRNWSEALLSKKLLWRILLVSVLNWIVVFGMFEWAYRTFLDVAVARTMAIQALILVRIVYLLTISQWGKAITAITQGQAAPSDDASFFALGIFASIILQIVFSQWDVMNTLFATAPLNLIQLLICFIPVLLMIPVAILANRLNPTD